VCQNCQKRPFFDQNFPEFPGISGFRGISGQIFTPIFPEFPPRVHPFPELIPEKTGENSPRNSGGFPGVFREVFPTDFGQKNDENQ